MSLFLPRTSPLWPIIMKNRGITLSFGTNCFCFTWGCDLIPSQWLSSTGEHISNYFSFYTGVLANHVRVMKLIAWKTWNLHILSKNLESFFHFAKYLGRYIKKLIIMMKLEIIFKSDWVHNKVKSLKLYLWLAERSRLRPVVFWKKNVH